MNEKVLKTLEFTKIIDKLASYAVSPMAKERARTLSPFTDITEIRREQAETSEAVSCALRKGNIPLGGLSDIRPNVKRAEMGGKLSIAELLAVGDTLYVFKKIRNYAKDEGKHEVYEILQPLFDAIKLMNTLEHDITSKIVSENEIADDASDALFSIRREKKVANERVKEQLNSIIHSQAYKNMLQDTVVTMRSGRYCVPVKQEYKNSFNGMVHDQSSTGATLFMEPASVLNLNNRLRELESREKEEIDKILYKLSGQVADNGEDILANVEILTHLDFLFAKASLSLSMGGSQPVFNESGRIYIKKARHPLLDKDKVVPTDIYLGDTFTTLLITGPNTGGKTVALKTVGLLQLMGQSGLQIPAFDKSELGVFDEVFADIGDEQSIEQSLSTFSSHMTNIVKILKEVTLDSLVLFDELGAGTDPTEGAALAMSILSYLHERRIRTAVTTHYSELKVYALSTDGVENASCEFDVETLRPTYRLLIGIPGKSNAFAISQKLGLPQHIIDGARELLSHEDARFEDIITDLEISKKSVEFEQRRAEEFRREAEKLKKDLESQKEKIQKQKDKIILDAKNEAKSILLRSKEEADEIVRKMNEMQKTLNRKGLDETRNQLRDKINDMESEIYSKEQPKRVLKTPKNLRIGDRVFVPAFNQTGIVSTLPDKSGDVIIKTGLLKITANISQLHLDETEEKTIPYKTNSTKPKIGKALNIRNEIDCRGMTVDEMLETADKYLDDAYLSNLLQVTIIHGKGTGALKQALAQHLKKHKHVTSFRPGKYGEGEDGVTVVEIKK